MGAFRSAGKIPAALCGSKASLSHSRRFLPLLILVLSGTLAAGAEDPHRFIAVTNWYATFTHTLSESANRNGTDPNTGDNCSASWQFDRSITISCQLIPDPQGGNDPDWREFVWKQNDSASVHFGDTFDQTCTSPGGSSDHQRITVNDVGLAPTNMFDLIIDAAAGTYQVGWCYSTCELPFTSEVTLNDLTFPGDIGIDWGPDGDSGPLPLPATGMVVQGQAVFSMHDRYWEIAPAFWGGLDPTFNAPFQSDLVLTWSLSPVVEELEVVIDPVDYETWLPEGNLTDQNAFGNTIRVHAVLQKKGGGQPVQQATKFIFELTNVSQEKGVCMNWPPEDQAGQGFDLQFETERNTPDQVTNVIDVVDAFTAETVGDPAYNADINVSSFDFGAFGSIKVTAIVGGKSIVGHLKTDPTGTITEVPLPRRSANDYVADRWKEDEGVTSQVSINDLDDEPMGDGHNGDGLSLYEEYRGFSVNGSHLRTRPKQKELFVLNDANADGSSGVALLKQGSGLEVYLLKPQEFGIQPDNTYTRIVNHNHGDASRHVVDQHGIWITTRSSVVGYAQAVSVLGFIGNGTPAKKSHVAVDPPNSKYAKRVVGRSVAGSDGQVSVLLNSAFSYAASTIAHELAHCCSVYHHGDLFANSEPVPVEVLGGPYAGGTHELAVGGVDGIWTLLNENGSVRTEAVGNKYAIGRKGGLFSGDDTCFMRYDNSNGYFSNTSPNSTIYLLFQNNTEPAGFTLCTSPTGTGINQASPGTPWPRYGDADAAHNRGNCKGQICINDSHANDASHIR